MAVCGESGCCCTALPGSSRCVVHDKVIRRQHGDAAIHCYACGRLVRIGARWLVREEGAFCLRAACLNARVDLSAIHTTRAVETRGHEAVAR